MQILVSLLYMLIMANVLFITKIKYNTIIKANVLFTLIWCSTAALSALGLFELYKPSMIVHFYSITAIIVFNTVFISLNNLNRNRYAIERINGFPRYKLIYLFNAIAWVFLSGFLLVSINIIQNQGFNVLRAYAFNSDMGLATTKELLVIQWIIQPIFVATTLISVVSFVIGLKNTKLYVVAIIDILVYTLLFGGRSLILNTMLFYIFSYLVININKKKKNRKSRINVKFIAIVLAILIVLTGLRSWDDSSFIKNAYTYYIGPYTFLDQLIGEFEWSSSPMYGYGILGFLINPIVAVFSLIFNFNYEGSDYLITTITSVPRFISPSQRYNAMTTMLYPFIRDFGYLGIIIGTTFLSWITSKIESMFCKSNQLLYLSLFIYVLTVLFDSVLVYQFLFPKSSITIFFLIIFLKNKDVIR